MDAFQEGSLGGPTALPAMSTTTLSTVSSSNAYDEAQIQDFSKERRLPSVTPRRFKRFFSPVIHKSGLSKARKALQNITAPNMPALPEASDVSREPEAENTTPRPSKKRKLATSSILSREGYPLSLALPRISPNYDEIEKHTDADLAFLPSSPCARAERGFLAQRNGAQYVSDQSDLEVSDGSDVEPEVEAVVSFSNPIRCLEARGLPSRLMRMSVAGLDRRRPYDHVPMHDWQFETTDFCSSQSDVQMCRSVVSAGRSIPFCTTSLNACSLIAIGDEDGVVRLLDTNHREDPSCFHKIFTSFQVHPNAIIDMDFTADDQRIATASGDQSARVVDMQTRTTLAVLKNHSASLKQIRFQPGQNNQNVLATSSRDGSIQLWDTRCRETLVERLRAHPGSDDAPSHNIGTVWDAHRGVKTSRTRSHDTHDASVSFREGDVSVTAIAFLPEGREHFLLTGSEANASVMLWDTRYLRRKSGMARPVAFTRQPQSHSQVRHFGISSINLSGDGSRMFSLCKDNTIYAYSTAHLVLGMSPELDSASTNDRPPPRRAVQEGLGPLYGYRHPMLHATSFYVKSALRRAKDGKCEMLAVGSADNCAIVFPTDERYLPRVSSSATDPSVRSDASGVRVMPPLRRSNSSMAREAIDEEIPISTNGTPLVNGHTHEVGSLAWTADGELITLGDDYGIRRWREDAGEAAQYRKAGLGSQQAWKCGWADMGKDWVEDDVTPSPRPWWDDFDGQLGFRIGLPYRGRA